jgi:hypothetical protein
MSTANVEFKILTDDLTEESLSEVPPCEMMWGWEPPWTPCSRPSVARVRLRCPVHGVEPPSFICDLCLEVVLAHGCSCCHCVTAGVETVLLLDGYC